MDVIEEAACMAAVAPARSAAARFAALCGRLDGELAAAAEVIERDADAAALALDGVLRRLLCAWYEARAYPLPAVGDVLSDLERRAPELAWRARLALSAPDAAARLARARRVVAAFAQSVEGRGGQPSAAERALVGREPGVRPGA